MNRNQKPANTTLVRHTFFENCTLGRLLDGEGKEICQTLEPRWRDLLHGERKYVGKTCIPSGTYSTAFLYDDHLKYKCLKVNNVRGFYNIRLCFLTKEGSHPHQTTGNILLGLEWDAASARLTEPAAAFKALKDYFEELRVNRQQIILEIREESYPPTILPAVGLMDAGATEDEDEDYMIETL